MGARPAGSDEIIPSWAPDRDALAWSANGIVLLEDGAEPVDLPSPEGVPEWSPDGRLLATATDEGLYVMDLTGAVQATVGGASVRPVGVFAWQALTR